VHEWLETAKNSESSSGFRLFGYDVPNSITARLQEREAMLSTVCCGAKGPIMAAASELDQDLDISKLSKENKQVVSEIPPMETQSKQGSTVSVRSRTKVHCIKSAGSV
jgi:auxin response factor